MLGSLVGSGVWIRDRRWRGREARARARAARAIFFKRGVPEPLKGVHPLTYDAADDLLGVVIVGGLTITKKNLQS